MSEIVFLGTVINRSDDKKFISFFKENEVYVVLECLAWGTASDELLDILGIGESDKKIFFSLIPGEKSRPLMKRLISKMHLNLPGNGIAFTVPVYSIGGTSVLNYFSGLNNNKGSDIKMEKHTEYELVLAITNRGYVNEVMDAAREAGAIGGTVVHAKNTVAEQAEKFFGVSIAAEKEMVFIIVQESIKNAVMKSIMTGAGINTKAKTIVFSMPVSDVAGLRSEEDDNE